MPEHTHDAVLSQVQALLPEAVDVEKVRPDDDMTWWVVNAVQETFAFAWYDSGDTLHTKPYRP